MWAFAPASLALLLLLAPGSAAGVRRLGDPVDGGGADGGGKLKVPELPSEEALSEFLSDHEYAAVLFVSPGGKGADARSDRAVSRLEATDVGGFGGANRLGLPFARVADREAGAAFGVSEVPAVVLFDDGVPEVYSGDVLDPLQVLQWVQREMRSDDVEVIDGDVLSNVVKSSSSSLLAVFVSDSQRPDDLPGLDQLRSICDFLDVSLALVRGKAAAARYGLHRLPAVAYFEDGVPSVYGGGVDPLSDPAAVVEWVRDQRTDDTVEKVTEEILRALVDDVEYLAVFFAGPCDARARTDQECRRVLADLERIDDELDDYGLTLVTTDEVKYAGRDLGVRKFPCLGVFRNGHFLAYNGTLRDDEEMRNWLLDKDTLELRGQVERVGTKMLARLVRDESHVLVMVYDSDSGEDREAEDLLDRLEHGGLARRLEAQHHELVRTDAVSFFAAEYGVPASGADELPALVLFENEVPMTFPKDGDMTDMDEVYSWFQEVVERQEVPTVDVQILRRCVDRIDDLVALFYDPTKKKHLEFIAEMELIDDDAEKLDINMVKLDSRKGGGSRQFGLTHFPAVVYFENSVPDVYDGDLTREDVQHWLHEHKTGGHAVKITGVMLDELKTSENFVAALFAEDCEAGAGACGGDQVARLVAHHDTLRKELGVLLVQTADREYVERTLGAKHRLPALGLFRNGDLLVFDGNVENDLAVMKFLSDLDNLLLDGAIEEVDLVMLEHLERERRDAGGVFAFLYDADDGRAQRVIRKLEAINDNLENDRVVLVRCSQEGADDEFGVGYLPRLVHLESGIPVPYVGDLSNEGDVLRWIADALRDAEVKEVTEPILERLTDKLDHVAVVFVDEDSADKRGGILSEFERIHDDLTTEGLTVVKISTEDYGVDLGLRDLPALVQFNDGIPNVYSGEEKGEAMMAWMAGTRDAEVIEVVTAQILSLLREEEEYLAVFFSGGKEDEDDEELSTALDALNVEVTRIGVSLVRCADPEYPHKEHGLTHFPALGLYRNGAFLRYDGDSMEAEELQKWFSDEANIKISGRIEEVNERLMSYLYETDDDIVIFFYEEDDRDVDEILEGLESVDDSLDKVNVSMVKIDDEGAADQFGVTELPAIVYIQSGIPNVFAGDVFKPKKVLKWVMEEANTTRIHEVSDIVLSRLVDKFDYLAAVFYTREEDPKVAGLQDIAEKCLDHSIAIVKLHDEEEAKRLGLAGDDDGDDDDGEGEEEDEDDEVKIVYFQRRVPSLVGAEAGRPQEVLEWLVKHKRYPTIEEITDKMLEMLVQSHEYVAVFFQGQKCEEEEEEVKEDGEGGEDEEEAGEEEEEESAGANKVDCDRVLAELEEIDDELDDIGILIVTTKDVGVAEDNGVAADGLPALGMFRNGHYIQYSRELESQKQMLDWMTDEETLKIIGIIDEVNLAMLENILREEDDAFVFFYEEQDTDAFTILEELESIDEKLDKQDLTMVKISDVGAVDAFGIRQVPALVYFEDGIPELYSGDLLNDNLIMKWMKAELKRETITEVAVPVLDRLVERGKTLAVLFADPAQEDDAAALAALETIDDECAGFEIGFVRLDDADKAAEYGLHETPGILYFENRIPSVYDGDLAAEGGQDELLEWLIEQKTTDTIEAVTDEILADLVEEEEYLAVYFSGPCEDDDPCHVVLQGLQEADRRVQDLGIMLVTTEERDWARQQLEVRGFPSFGLFRNGEFALFEGDLEDAVAVLEWLTDGKTLKVADAIEEVNRAMLDYLVEVETDVVAFLYREGNLQDEIALDSLETVDDELDERGAQFVKCRDRGVEKHYGLGSLPVVVHFRHGVPLAYDGEEDSAEDVLAWVEANMRDESVREEVSASVLDVLIQKHGHLAVLFYEDDPPEGLGPLDEVCERDGVTLVQISDEGKAIQLGLERSRALVYFEERVPALYVGPAGDVGAMAEWVASRKKADTAPAVTDAILENVVGDFEYVAAFFPSPPCKESDERCREVAEAAAANVEEVADQIEDLGVVLVRGTQRTAAVRQCNVTAFPALVLFRNGLPAVYPGRLEEEGASKIAAWMSDSRTLEIVGQIERVNRAMLRDLVASEDAVLAFFCDPADKNLDETMSELETVDDNLESEAVEFVWCSDRDALDDFGLVIWPSLVFFERGVPVVFSGSLKNDDTILGWVTKELRDEGAALREVKSAVLDSLLDRLEFVAVVYRDKSTPDGAEDAEAMGAMREAADEARMHDINFVVVSEPRLLSKLGPDAELPALVYYENNIPFVYSAGKLSDRAAVLEWLVRQRNVATIEEVRDSMLDEILEENEFVAVLFMGLCTEDDEAADVCEKVLNNLEKIDQSLDEFGVVMVRTCDVDGRARELWISKFPALVYYRNGEALRYPGRLADAGAFAVFKWLTSEKTLNVQGRILQVNGLMLGKMAARLKNMFAFFYEEGDILAERILGGLEELEDQLAELGVDFVKACEPGLADDYDLDELPVLGHFRGGQLGVYHGDLRQRDRLAKWVEEVTKEEGQRHRDRVESERKSAARKKAKRKKKSKQAEPAG